MEQYFGTYQTFQTPSRKDAAVLMGPDNLVGDSYRIDVDLSESEPKAWLINRFNQPIGFFDEPFSRKISLLKADGLKICALLSFVAFSETEEGGEYWGQMAVIAYNPAYEREFSSFIDNIAHFLIQGIRPKIDLGAPAVAEVISSEGQWTPREREALPAKEKGMALLKTRRSITDNLVEAGRKGNKGCYLISWAFLLALVALIIFALKTCGVF